MKRRIPWKIILAAAGLVLLVFLIMDLNQRLDMKNGLAEQVATVRIEATHVMETQVALVTQVAYAGSDDAVAQWALENGQVKEGETLIRLIPGEGSVPSQPPVVRESPIVVKNWQVWWELFFGNN